MQNQGPPTDEATDTARATSEKPLQSWKEIAAYLDRAERTARRWEKEAGLPVHRLHQDKRSSVYAYPSELDAWRGARGPEDDEDRTIWSLLQWGVPMALGILVVVFGGWFLTFGPILNPPNPLVEAEGITVRQVLNSSGAPFEGAPSPDGKHLSFVDWRTGDLAVRDLETGTIRRLTNKGSWSKSSEYAYFSRWSPDSQQLAFGWCGMKGSDLRIVDTDDPKPRILYKSKRWKWVFPSDWSPDGKHILVYTTNQSSLGGQLALISVGDGAERVLSTTYGEHAAFSPDGRYIAYHRKQRNGITENDIFVLSVGDDRETKLVEHPANDTVFGWSPDGNWLLFGSDRSGAQGFWVVKIVDGKAQGDPRIVKLDVPNAIALGITRRGSFYYGTSSRNENVYTARLDPNSGNISGQPEKVTQRYEGLCASPAYSPDGKFLAYACSRTPIYGYSGRNILRIRSLETGQERELSTSFGSIHNPRWLPDSRFILITGIDAKRMGIYKMDTQTGETEPIVREARVNILGNEPSPDGKGLFYVKREPEGDRCRILYRNLETGEEREIYRASLAESLNISVSPDGRFLAFLNRTNPRILRIISADGGDPSEVLRFDMVGDANIGTEWSADGKYLLFSKPLDPNAEEWEWGLTRVSVDGQQSQKLDVGINCRGISVHPDGQQVAFVSQGGNSFNGVWVIEDFLPEP